MTTEINGGAVGGASGGGTTIVNSDNPVNVVIESQLKGTLQARTEIMSDTARHSVIFAPPILGMSIKVRHANAIGIAIDQGILLTVDASDDGVADVNLDEAQVGVRLNVMPDDTFQEFVFEGSLVSRIDMKGVGDSPDLVVTLGGVY